MVFSFIKTEQTNYKMKLKPDLATNIQENFAGMKFLIYIENESFIKQIEIVRQILIITSILGGLIYIFNYMKISKEMVTFEHKFLYYLSIT